MAPQNRPQEGANEAGAKMAGAARFRCGGALARQRSRACLPTPAGAASDCCTMDTPPAPSTPPSHFTPPVPAPKKGLGTGAKIGIGCGGLILLIIIGFVIVGVMFGGKMKQFAEDAQKNPTRATAAMMVSVSGGKIAMVAEDDTNLRYTVKDTKSGILTTIYWDEKTKTSQVIQGDFSAIPTDPAIAPEAEGETAPEVEEK